MTPAATSTSITSKESVNRNASVVKGAAAVRDSLTKRKLSPIKEAFRTAATYAGIL